MAVRAGEAEPRLGRVRLPVRVRLGWVAALCYGAVLAYAVDVYGGVPGSRDTLFALVVGGLLAASATSVARLRRTVVALAVDWLPFVLALWLYDLIRGWADGAWLPIQWWHQIRVDEIVGHGSVPTVWLQRHLWHGAAHLAWYDYASWAVYMSYFFATTLVLAVLWWRRRDLFRRLAALVVALAFLGCITFVLFPAAPPWLAAQHGYIDHVDRVVWIVGGHVPWISLGTLWETGTRYTNEVAAIPSLHAGFTLLVTLFGVRHLRTRWRHLLWLYPAAMGFALVYSAEHYATDILAGWVYCLVAWALVELVVRRRAAAASQVESAG